MIQSNLYRMDLERAVDSFGDLYKLKNKSIFITGANGLICSSLVDCLICMNQKYNLNVSLFLGSRNIEMTDHLFNVKQNKFITIIQYDATRSLIFDNEVDYYIHGASPASPNLFVSNPVDTMKSNVFGLEEILIHARRNNSRVLYISSSEVYGKLNNQLPIKEDDYGYMDILNPRSSYGMSKRASETLCASYNQQFGLDCVIARPGHIYGPTATVNDKRVSSEFMYNAAYGKDIVLKSKGEQIRSYTYSLDCAIALLYVLLKGATGEAYNISNKHSVCPISKMAECFALAGGVELKYEIPAVNEVKAFNPMLNSSLNSDKLENLGWIPVFSMVEGFEHSVAIVKEKSRNC